MAQDKFKKLLSRELSHLSERSRSGQFVAEWVNTIAGTNNGEGEREGEGEGELMLLYIRSK